MPLMYKSNQDLYGKKYYEVVKRFNATEKLREHVSSASKRKETNTKKSTDPRQSLKERLLLHTKLRTEEDLEKIRSTGLGGGVTVVGRPRKLEKITKDRGVENSVKIQLTELLKNDTLMSERHKKAELTTHMIGNSQPPTYHHQRSPFIPRIGNKNQFFNRSFTDQEGQRSQSEPAFLPPINGLPPLSKVGKKSLRQVQSVSPPVSKNQNTPIPELTKVFSRLGSLKELSRSTETLNSLESGKSNGPDRKRRKIKQKHISSQELPQTPQLKHGHSQESITSLDMADRTSGKHSIDKPGTMRRKIQEFKQWHSKSRSNTPRKQTSDSDLGKPPAHGQPKKSKDDEETMSTERDVNHEESDAVVDNDCECKENENTEQQVEVAADEYCAPDSPPHIVIEAPTQGEVTPVINPSPDVQLEAAVADEDSNTAMSVHIYQDNNPHTLRLSSAKTWQTWRSKNDSYAYHNVNQYIEDNHLMPTDKRTWIERWVSNVDSSLNCSISQESTEIMID